MAKYYHQIKPGLNKPEFIETISAKSAEVVEWLISHGAVIPAKYGVPGLTAGGFENLYEHVTPAKTRSHWVEGGGPGLFAAFKNAVESRGIRVQLNTRAQRLIQNPATGDIVGVRAVQNGKEVAIKAKKGVVLATGGFVHNKEMLTAYAPYGDGYPGAKGSPGAVGDGILMAQEVGASLWAMHEILESLGLKDVGTAYFTPFMEYTVIVNAEGKRFIKEDAWTEPITEETLKQPQAVAFLVFDSKLRARDEVNTTVGTAIPVDKVIEAPSIPELAEKLGVDGDALQATIDEYNSYCESGEDPLGKGQKALFPVKEAPFYGIIADPLPVITTGGLLTSVNAEVLNPFDEPISRLYAAGEVTGGKCVGYPGCGTSITECITFGRIAGRNAAQLADW
jgi:succinate dehydrogenase/fumarate reductase flavoprotein subunit